jgi:hypothetical protein
MTCRGSLGQIFFAPVRAVTASKNLIGKDIIQT